MIVYYFRHAFQNTSKTIGARDSSKWGQHRIRRKYYAKEFCLLISLLKSKTYFLPFAFLIEMNNMQFN